MKINMVGGIGKQTVMILSFENLIHHIEVKQYTFAQNRFFILICEHWETNLTAGRPMATSTIQPTTCA